MFTIIKNITELPLSFKKQVTVTEGRFILIERDDEEPSKANSSKNPSLDYHDPWIVSETEIPQVGDLVFDPELVEVYQLEEPHSNLKKVIVCKDQFSRKQIKAMESYHIKHGDLILVECQYVDEVRKSLLHLWNSTQFAPCSKEVLAKIENQHIISLDNDNHVTLYPRLYTPKELDVKFDQFIEHCSAYTNNPSWMRTAYGSWIADEANIIP
jgi:hypothetical protein